MLVLPSLLHYSRSGSVEKQVGIVLKALRVEISMSLHYILGVEYRPWRKWTTCWMDRSLSSWWFRRFRWAEPNRLEKQLRDLRDSCNTILARYINRMQPSLFKNFKDRCRKWRDDLNSQLANPSQTCSPSPMHWSKNSPAFSSICPAYDFLNHE